MQPERYPPDDAREWLSRASGNLLRAKAMAPGFYLEDLCFDAQQAAEKAIKGVLIARGIAFPYVHDLARLLDLLEQAGEEVPPSVADADRLTRFAFATRYPGAAAPVTEEEYRRAVAVAETVVAWADERVRQERARATG
jgi:HEPN domain-containing protein